MPTENCSVLPLGAMYPHDASSRLVYYAPMLALAFPILYWAGQKLAVASCQTDTIAGALIQLWTAVLPYPSASGIVHSVRRL